MSKEQFSLVEQEILEMLEKGAIQKVVPTPGQFLSDFYLVEKKDGGNRIGKVPIALLRRVNIRIIIYLDDMLLNGEDITRNSHGKNHIDFSIATFGFCDQPQKISHASCEINRVSGLSKRYRKNNFRFF